MRAYSVCTRSRHASDPCAQKNPGHGPLGLAAFLCKADQLSAQAMHQMATAEHQEKLYLMQTLDLLCPLLCFLRIDCSAASKAVSAKPLMSYRVT